MIDLVVLFAYRDLEKELIKIGVVSCRGDAGESRVLLGRR